MPAEPLSARSWEVGDLDFREPETWYKSDYCNKYPFLRQVAASDILLGCEPPEKFIRRDTKVLALGSCFAEHFVSFLAREGYNRWQLPPEPDGASSDVWVRFWTAFENIFVILQQFRWAFGEFKPEPKTWFTKDKKQFEATEDRRQRVRYAFENADAFVITLGLSEVWFDLATNEPMWRTIPVRYYEPGRHVCRRVTVGETVAAFHEFDRIVEQYAPGKRFILTLSPIPLTATFRNQSAVIANQVSKAVLRVALDEFTGDEIVRNKSRYYYFPSYELVHHIFDKPFLDNFHIRPSVAGFVFEAFKSLYTDLPTVDLNLAPLDNYVRDLEERNCEMDRQLLAKEKVIRELDFAARERLEIINRLSAKAAVE